MGRVTFRVLGIGTKVLFWPVVLVFALLAILEAHVGRANLPDFHTFILVIDLSSKLRYRWLVVCISASRFIFFYFHFFSPAHSPRKRFY